MGLKKGVPLPALTLQNEALYDALDARIEQLRQGRSSKETSVAVNNFIKLESTINKSISALSQAYQSALTEQGEKNAITEMRAEIDKYDQLYELVKAFAVTSTDPTLQIFLLRMQMNDLTHKGRVRKSQAKL